MQVLKAAEVSRLARIAANTKLARNNKKAALRRLKGHARQVAEVLIGENIDASEDVTHTANVVKHWTARQE